MICKNCPFGEIKQIDTNIEPIFYIECPFNSEEHNLNDECFFPETIMEKGV